MGSVKTQVAAVIVDPVIPESRQRWDIRNLEKAIIFWIPALGFTSPGMTISITPEP
jgi:hypothetical protein